MKVVEAGTRAVRSEMSGGKRVLKLQFDIEELRLIDIGNTLAQFKRLNWFNQWTHK